MKAIDRVLWVAQERARCRYFELSWLSLRSAEPAARRVGAQVMGELDAPGPHLVNGPFKRRLS